MSKLPHKKSKQDYTNNIGLLVAQEIFGTGDEAFNSTRNCFLSKMWKNM
jgi:hypothetical protein